MMKLNVKMLCDHLDQTVEKAAVSSENCNPYLLEKILWPLLYGKTIRLQDIEYERFESEDINAIVDYYEKLEVHYRKLGQMMTAVDSAPPTACQARLFC